MKIVTKPQRQEFKNGDNCVVYEYPMGDDAINGAIAKLSGRYPDKGESMNEICKEMAYVIEGKGMISVNGTETKIQKGDLVLIEPGEKYFWQDNMELFMPCTPAWTPKQYKIFE